MLLLKSKQLFKNQGIFLKIILSNIALLNFVELVLPKCLRNVFAFLGENNDLIYIAVNK